MNASCPTRRALLRRTLLLGSLGLLPAGCGGEPPVKPPTVDETGIREFAGVYRSFTKKTKRAPKNLKELRGKGQGHPNAFEMVSSGELVVRWGAPLPSEGEGANTVLAYIKTVPERGGDVLMQDGTTIRTMTADEFKAAPKAGGG